MVKHCLAKYGMNQVQYSRHSLLEDVIGTIARLFVLIIVEPGGPLVQTLQLLILSVLQNLSYMPQDAVHLHKMSCNCM